MLCSTQRIKWKEELTQFLVIEEEGAKPPNAEDKWVSTQRLSPLRFLEFCTKIIYRRYILTKILSKSIRNMIIITCQILFLFMYRL